MAEEYPQTPQKLRDDGERCFRLASTITDTRAHDPLMEYGRGWIGPRDGGGTEARELR